MKDYISLTFRSCESTWDLAQKSPRVPTVPKSPKSPKDVGVLGALSDRGVDRRLPLLPEEHGGHHGCR